MKADGPAFAVVITFFILWASVLFVLSTGAALVIPLSGCLSYAPSTCRYVPAYAVYLGAAYLFTALTGLGLLVKRLAKAPRPSGASGTAASSPRR